MVELCLSQFFLKIMCLRGDIASKREDYETKNEKDSGKWEEMTLLGEKTTE